jgi:hypothetical protein
MDVIANCPTGGVGGDGMTLAEMAECWEQGKTAMDDANYDVCQHAWLRLQALVEARA